MEVTAAVCDPEKSDPRMSGLERKVSDRLKCSKRIFCAIFSVPSISRIKDFKKKGLLDFLKTSS